METPNSSSMISRTKPMASADSSSQVLTTRWSHLPEA